MNCWNSLWILEAGDIPRKSVPTELLNFCTMPKRLTLWKGQRRKRLFVVRGAGLTIVTRGEKKCFSSYSNCTWHISGRDSFLEFCEESVNEILTIRPGQSARFRRKCSSSWAGGFYCLIVGSRTSKKTHWILPRVGKTQSYSKNVIPDEL